MDDTTPDIIYAHSVHGVCIIYKWYPRACRGLVSKSLQGAMWALHQPRVCLWVDGP